MLPHLCPHPCFHTLSWVRFAKSGHAYGSASVSFRQLKLEGRQRVELPDGGFATPQHPPPEAIQRRTSTSSSILRRWKFMLCSSPDSAGRQAIFLMGPDRPIHSGPIHRFILWSPSRRLLRAVGSGLFHESDSRREGCARGLAGLGILCCCARPPPSHNSAIPPRRLPPTRLRRGYGARAQSRLPAPGRATRDDRPGHNGTGQNRANPA